MKHISEAVNTIDARLEGARERAGQYLDSAEVSLSMQRKTVVLICRVRLTGRPKGESWRKTFVEDVGGGQVTAGLELLIERAKLYCGRKKEAE